MYRSHGDPSGGVERPHRQMHMEREHPQQRSPRADRAAHAQRPQRTTGANSVRAADARRRRTNVLFLLVVITACTLFLAMTMGSTLLLYVFALSFLATCGFVYQLSQRRRERDSWNDGWLEHQR